jgi:hypothetical protein
MARRPGMSRLSFLLHPTSAVSLVNSMLADVFSGHSAES